MADRFQYAETIYTHPTHRPGVEVRVSLGRINGHPLVDVRLFAHGNPTDRGIYIPPQEAPSLAAAILRAAKSSGARLPKAKDGSTQLLQAEAIGRAARICREVADKGGDFSKGADACFLRLQDEVSRLLAEMAKGMPK